MLVLGGGVKVGCETAGVVDLGTGPAAAVEIGGLRADCSAGRSERMWDRLVEEMMAVSARNSSSCGSGLAGRTGSGQQNGGGAHGADGADRAVGNGRRDGGCRHGRMKEEAAERKKSRNKSSRIQSAKRRSWRGEGSEWKQRE